MPCTLCRCQVLFCYNSSCFATFDNMRNKTNALHEHRTLVAKPEQKYLYMPVFTLSSVRDPREHHAACGCAQRCADVVELGVTNRSSALQRLEDVLKSGKEVGVTFALGLERLMTREFGEGCLGRGERKVNAWCC